MDKFLNILSGVSFVLLLAIIFIPAYLESYVLPTNHKNTVGRVIGKITQRRLEIAKFEFVIDSGDTIRTNNSTIFTREGEHLLIQYIPGFSIVKKTIYSHKIDVDTIPFGTELPDSVLFD